jgi:putative colanic acid biosysnthesis UDP-glucose lipid carrier transferase
MIVLEVQDIELLAYFMPLSVYTEWFGLLDSPSTASPSMSSLYSIQARPFRGVEVRQLPGLLHGRDDTHAHIETLLDPLAIIASLWISAFAFDDTRGPEYLVLSLVLVLITFPGKSRLHVPWFRLVTDLALLSTILIGLLVIFGWATRNLRLFPVDAILAWLWIAPVCLVAAHGLFRVGAPLMLKRTQRCVIVGMNEQGMALARRIDQNPYTATALVGFFDDRAEARQSGMEEYPILGRFDDLAAFAMRHRIHVIYLSLPMATQERTLKLLAELRDTTASIYFVPDQFVTELIQCRMSSVVDIPVVAVCETPFVGVTGILKRFSDIVVSASALAILWPAILLIAILVRLDSPGPAIFRQRRYGLDGAEIIIYKFRSMRVAEDTGVIHQARRDDARVTPIGAVLRKTSLDELPQLFNVLKGQMSLVGPRPHAVAHNELYRKAIKGYMVRHKVRPGITGWAQVNGLRGETETIDKMEARVRYDLDYLRNWSLGLDLHILLKTVAIVFRDRHAY